MLSPLLQEQLHAALQGLAYGSIQLIIHEGKIVRIERNERIRLTDSSEASTSTFGRPTPTAEARRNA